MNETIKQDRINVDTAKNAPIVIGNTPIGIVTEYSNGIFDCKLWDKCVCIESIDGKINAVVIKPTNILYGCDTYSGASENNIKV